MSTGGALRELARFLDACEATEVATSVGAVHTEEGRLTAELTVELPGSALSVRSSETGDGSVELTVEAAEVLPTTGTVAVEPGAASLGPDGSVTVELVAAVPVDDGGDDTGADRAETAGGPTDASEREVPPFEDPELLAEVYDSCGTFAEMTDALGMDVTPETVRRYMIEHGIHRPDSYGTDDDSGPEPEPEPADGEAARDGRDGEPDGTTEPDEKAEERVVLTDGVGLPEGVTVEGLIEAVRRSTTLSGVEHRTGLERGTARQTLRELDLLDLVGGRVATEAGREISRADVIDRLREASRQERRR
jgi:hypothetical protein